MAVLYHASPERLFPGTVLKSARPEGVYLSSRDSTECWARDFVRSRKRPHYIYEVHVKDHVVLDVHTDGWWTVPYPDETVYKHWHLIPAGEIQDWLDIFEDDREWIGMALEIVCSGRATVRRCVAVVEPRSTA